MVIKNFPQTFPNNTAISWNYATDCSPIGICGFLAIDWGNYANSPTQIPVTPLQVNNMTEMTASHNLTFGGTSSGYDVIYDSFLYDSPAQATRLFELEVFLHTPSYSASFVQGATPKGTVAISGITWTVGCYCGNPSGNDILFMPSNQADVPVATIDILAMYQWAKSKGIITGNEWFTGMAIGAEPQTGAGNLTINTFSAGYTNGFGPTTIIGDNTNYPYPPVGVYNGYMAPFNTPPGVEITPNQMAVIPANFPNNTTFTWNYQAPGCSSVGVCGFLAIDYGNAAGSAQTIPVVQPNNLLSLTETHNLTFGGTLSGYDVIDDMFLYDVPAQTNRLFEFEVGLHANPQYVSFVQNATQKGTTTISGISWTVACNCAQTTPDILFLAGTVAAPLDVSNATIDLRAMLLFAKSLGIITGNEYFTGFAMGAEPIVGDGRLTVNAFSASSSHTTTPPTIDGISTIAAASGSTTVTVNLSTTKTNDLVLLWISQTGFATNMISDTAGLQWALRTNTPGPSSVLEYYAKAPAILTNDTITLTMNNGAFTDMVAAGFNGTSQLAPFDGGAPVQQGSAPVNITTLEPDSLVFGGCNFSDVFTPTANTGAGWIPILSGVGSFSMVQYQVFSASGTHSFSTNNDTSATACTVDALEGP